MTRAVVFAAMLGALGCRPRIDAVSVPPRVVPPRPTTDVRVCWIESKRFGPGTASVLVVRHPDGDVLIDAGASTAFREEIAVYDGRDRRWFKRLPGLLVPKRPLAQTLREAGIDPAALRYFVPTHAHIDHVGGFVDLPETPVLLDADEIALVERGRNEVIFEVVPAHAEAISPHVQPIVYRPLAYEIYDRHADLFGDGTVVVVPMHGHTPGSVGVFIHRRDGERIFHVGDAANERAAIKRRRGRRPSLRRTDTDPRAAARTLARLHALAEAAPDLAILPAHDRRAWADIFGRPTKHCR
jgi:glyoxylase-like metal-dependent hydrolase (beta-lactamase superfamily II)